jgi:hypothetical protein
MRRIVDPLAYNVKMSLEGRVVPVSRTQPPKPVPVPSPGPPPVKPRPPAAAVSSNGGVPAPHQKVLDAIAWYEALGVMAPTRVQIAMIAGYTHSSGGYNNIISKLNTSGYVNAVKGTKTVALTEEGRALATDPGLPTTNEGVQASILARLPAPQAKLLHEIIEEYPNPITREELAARTGYTATSGGYNNLISKLRTGALIEYAEGRSVVALDVLFPLGT